MENGPGLKNLDLGMTFSISFANGNETNCTMSGERVKAMARYQKNWLTKPSRAVKIAPSKMTRKVQTGMVGSSVLQIQGLEKTLIHI